MKVRELMAILERQNPEAAVVLVTHRYDSMESSLSRVAVRALLGRDNDGEDERAEYPPVEPSDVLLVDGEDFLRYGSSNAWAQPK